MQRLVSRPMVYETHALKVSKGRMAAMIITPARNAAMTATVPVNANTDPIAGEGRRLRKNTQAIQGIGTKSHHVECAKNKPVNPGGALCVSVSERMTNEASKLPARHSTARASVSNQGNTRIV